MMLEAVEKRFGGHPAAHPVEMLSDNGSHHTARDTRIFASQLGPRPCFTPVKSPESNGISLAILLGPMADNGSPFVNTLKRDYVRVTPLPAAQDVLDLVGGWIEDHNKNRPHSGLKMLSPREFIAAQTATAEFR